jgi:1,2-diacylglycerol 3-alpha-glucosyltransferase
MKILVFAPFFPPDPTGSSIFAGQQVRELIRQGHDVLVVTNRADSNAPVANETDDLEAHFGPRKIVRLRSFRVNLGKITWNYGIPVSLVGMLSRIARRTIRDFVPEAVIVHSTLFDLSLIGLVIAKQRHVPSVIVSHTALWHDKWVVNRAMRTFGRIVLGPAIQRAGAHLVCVDKWTLQNAEGLFGEKFQISTIPVSVELGQMQGGSGVEIKQRHGISDEPVLLSLGHVVPIRNRVNLTRALPDLVSRHPRLRVVIVGMVKDTTFLNLASELGVLEHIVLAGPVPHSEIREYLAIADVEAHDLDGLGLGITSVEAMDAGVPIVAWSVDDNYPQFSLRGYGPSGFIDDGEPETIASKIDEILTSRDFRDAVVSSQRLLVDDIFSVESVTRQYVSLLQSL